MIDTLRRQFEDAGLESELINAFKLVESGVFKDVPYVSVGVERAVEAWFRFRSVHEGTNRFPSLVPTNIVDWSAGWEVNHPASVIAAAIKIEEDPEWLIRVQERFDQIHRFGSWTARSHELVDYRGDWPPDISPRSEFYLPGFFQCDGKVTFLLPECAEPWMMPAVLYAGGKNDQPDAVQQCAMLRRWYQRWGAEPVCCWGSFYELFVSRPPTDKTSALNLAFEHAWLCFDRIDQASPKIHSFPHGVEGLASVLLNSSVWYLWWD